MEWMLVLDYSVSFSKTISPQGPAFYRITQSSRSLHRRNCEKFLIFQHFNGQDLIFNVNFKANMDHVEGCGTASGRTLLWRLAKVETELSTSTVLCWKFYDGARKISFFSRIRCDHMMKAALRRQHSDGGKQRTFFEGAEERKRNGHEGSVWENINESVHELLYCVISRRDYQLWRHVTRILKVQFAYVVFSFQFIHGLDIFRSFLYLRRAGPSGDFRPVDWNMRGVGLCCLTDDTRCQAADWWPL